MLVDELLKKIELKLPAQSAMDGDRIGLQIEGELCDLKRILVTLELNDEVAEEAVRRRCDCIITFHPLIYTPLLSITNNNRTGRIIQKLIKNSQTLISIHTNFDAFSEGTSKIFADKLGLTIDGFLLHDDSIPNCGIGVIAHPENPLSEHELLEKVALVCNAPLRWTSGRKSKISKIAIVGGSGFSFAVEALKSGADAFITADVSYHRFHELFGNMMLIDPGHYEMEQFVPEGLAFLLKSILSTDEYVSIDVSETVTNPVKYFPETEKYLELQLKKFKPHP